MKSILSPYVLVFILSLLVNAEDSSQKHDSKRAMWVWSPTKSKTNLPANQKKPSKEQLNANKKHNKHWDGVNSRIRFQQNYKGVQDLFFDFCEQQSINELYMFGTTWEWGKKSIANQQLPDEDFWVKFNTQAKSKGIRVWLMFYLWDNSNDLRMNSETESMKAHAQAVLNFNRKHPKAAFVGIHCDQEPSKKQVYKGLLQNMQEAQSWLRKQKSNLLISQALRPAWLRENFKWNGHEKLMSEHIVDEIPHVALMCYNDNFEVIKKWSKPLVEYTANANKKAAIGFEVNNLFNAWPKAENETWWEEINSVKREKRFQRKLDDKEITFEDAMYLTEKLLSKSQGYDRMVIHSYSGYFEHVFGQAPRDYIKSLPGKKYSSVKP
ncbi:MAG: hypothetical protein NE330_02820 [Lentisphaeraceae bacterium]|nr:hypothetical protein [Lentisphaeraceae bacterium]